jgi:hypothetical protein
MDKMTGQTIDQQTTAGSNQIDPLPFRGYSVPAPSLRYYGLSEMRPKGPTGRPRIPGNQMIMKGGNLLVDNDEHLVMPAMLKSPFEGVMIGNDNPL